jgi:hypothetical protein
MEPDISGRALQEITINPSDNPKLSDAIGSLTPQIISIFLLIVVLSSFPTLPKKQSTSPKREGI